MIDGHQRWTFYRPRLEQVAQGVHVAIGANSWVTEKIPRAADVAASREW